MSETLSSGLTLEIPDESDTDWADSIRDGCFQPISEHAHTGGGDGNQITTAAIADGAVTAPKLAAGILTIPAGVVFPYVGASAPTGYLLCNGAAVSRTTYATLFAIISTLYGAGDGTTTFNLPDMRQRFPLGKAASGTGNVLGGTGGNIDHTHSTPAHSHVVDSHTHSTPAHSHTVASHTHSVPAHYHGLGTGADLFIDSSGSHSHQLTAKYGNNTTHSHSTNPGQIAEAQTDSIGDSATPHDTTSVGHQHLTASFQGRIGLVTGGVDGNAAMTSGAATPGTDTSGSGTSGAAAPNTDTSGSGTSGTNNPPFQTFNFIIKT